MSSENAQEFHEWFERFRQKFMEDNNLGITEHKNYEAWIEAIAQISEDHGHPKFAEEARKQNTLGTTHYLATAGVDMEPVKAVLMLLFG